MFAVASRAVGCQKLPVLKGPSVETSVEFVDGVAVAHAAVDRSQMIFVRELLDHRLFVARNAPYVSMDGIGEEVSIDKKGYLFAVSVRDEIPLAMTHETILVLLS